MSAIPPKAVINRLNRLRRARGGRTTRDADDARILAKKIKGLDWGK